MILLIKYYSKKIEGKSTLVKLISGLYSPQKGYIYDKRDVTFSYATQRETFFSDTIENNISLSEKTDELLLETTLNKASMDFKEHSKKTVLMKNGQPLSGGQQKRINLARAFYRDSDILILDEPTASLDLKTKKQVLKAIKEEKKKRAVILITHDPDTSAICDRFLERK
ncbi:MAG: ATP-binding cassette domain-containing protein [Candidatus Moranbacteria bacterium]|nr:ATP-binding cassette domain-containing protein [Candidatus Moranbacteria bacterium]